MAASSQGLSTNRHDDQRAHRVEVYAQELLVDLVLPLDALCAKTCEMAAFAQGQYVELYPTIPSSKDESIDGGTRGIIQAVKPTRPDEDVYIVAFAFLRGERLDSEQAWLREVDLVPA